MKYAAARPYAYPKAAARKLIEQRSQSPINAHVRAAISPPDPAVLCVHKELNRRNTAGLSHPLCAYGDEVEGSSIGVGHLKAPVLNRLEFAIYILE